MMEMEWDYGESDRLQINKIIQDGFPASQVHLFSDCWAQIYLVSYNWQCSSLIVHLKTIWQTIWLSCPNSLNCHVINVSVGPLYTFYPNSVIHSKCWLICISFCFNSVNLNIRPEESSSKQVWISTPSCESVYCKIRLFRAP